MFVPRKFFSISILVMSSTWDCCRTLGLFLPSFSSWQQSTTRSLAINYPCYEVITLYTWCDMCTCRYCRLGLEDFLRAESLASPTRLHDHPSAIAREARIRIGKIPGQFEPHLFLTHLLTSACIHTYMPPAHTC